MIGGKLKLKNSKGFEQALKLKRRAEMTTDELQEKIERSQKNEQEQKKR